MNQSQRMPAEWERTTSVLPLPYQSIHILSWYKDDRNWKWKRMKRFKNQGKDDQEGIDNFILAVGLYITTTHAFQLQISLLLICRLGVLKMWELRFWYHLVTPRFRGYGDVTATYIRRADIPSHIYAKHQYRQESEYRNTVVIYIPAIMTQLNSYHKAWYNISRI